ncbi:hypothetical protein JVT61DRAFT_6800 [Boletus reticuloceps]|uniref:Uncharacterized protein n=1 Tax=Boletus reticuloceps TaxID=495285 RepID=A0A8I2YK07_9AGAM|nr:hypothetical protein JVT61DRAFT_6800 [Boletus reticuloceps]
MGLQLVALRIRQEKIQQHILLHVVFKNPSLTKYTLTTRTAAVVFALCVLSPEDPTKILETYLPNDTKVWRRWKETVLQRFRNKEKLHFKEEDWNLSGYTDEERKLLCSLYGDAQTAYDGFMPIDNKEMPAEKS